MWAQCLETIKQQFSKRFTCKKSQEHKSLFQFPTPGLFSSLSLRRGWGGLHPVRLTESDRRCNLSSGGHSGYKGRTTGAGMRRAGPWSGRSGSFLSGTTEAKAAGVRKRQVSSHKSLGRASSHDVTGDGSGSSPVKSSRADPDCLKFTLGTVHALPSQGAAPWSWVTLCYKKRGDVPPGLSVPKRDSA